MASQIATLQHIGLITDEVAEAAEKTKRFVDLYDSSQDLTD